MKASSYNILFVIVACALAHLWPAELLLVAYAFLGPAHYLSEISWLHDRKYFAGNRYFAAVMVVGTLLIIKFPQYWDSYIWGSLALAIAIRAGEGFLKRSIILCAAALLYFFAYKPFGTLAIIVMVLLPTVIHVFAFTFLFLLRSWLKKPDAATLLTLTLIAAAVASFFFGPGESNYFLSAWAARNINFFSKATYGFSKVVGLQTTRLNLLAVLKFLAFAYTFHYLNWFSKTRILKWHEISRLRMSTILAGYVLFVGIYLYDYQTGLKTLFFLSTLHVILEFPLDILTIQDIGRLARARLLTESTPQNLSAPVPRKKAS